MKKSINSLKKVLPSIEKAIVKTGFKVSKIAAAKDSASFALQGVKQDKLFFQILTLTEERPGFAIVEIFVSNLSVTEKWVDIEVSLDVLTDLITEMMKAATKELNQSVTVEKLDSIAKKIEMLEPKLDASIHELHHCEDLLMSDKLDAKARTKVEAKLAKVEATCLKNEMEISRLAFRYFTNLMDSIEPFFFNALMTVKWASKK